MAPGVCGVLDMLVGWIWSKRVSPYSVTSSAVTLADIFRRCGAGRHSRIREQTLDIHAEVLSILDEILGLQGRSAGMTADTPLLGAVPELDSMAVVGVIGALEERFEIFFDDDEIDGQTFATVGSLVDAIRAKVA